jgi:branched-chain amino acid transport system ATP-binding protein
MTLLEVAGLSKAFGGVRALSDVGFSVEKGEVLGFMGANGAGKTTLFSLIAGHQRSDGGRIRYLGQDLAGKRPDQICRAGIARTFQIVRPFRGLSVLENVETAALFGPAEAPDAVMARERAREILVDLDLSDRAAQPAGTLTLAGQKRLEVARALATRPRVLLLDEVMAGLTPPEVQAMLASLRRLREKHELTLLVIEHVMRALMQLCGRIVVLHHGEVIAEGSPAGIARDPRVLSVYFGEAATP